MLTAGYKNATGCELLVEEETHPQFGARDRAREHWARSGSSVSLQFYVNFTQNTTPLA